MSNTIKKRPAFSMLELIFVIIILGIVASIGSELIAKVYESYIIQRAQHNASIKTQVTINQISNYIRNAIPGTVIRRAGIAGAAESLQQAMGSAPGSYTVLQWVGSDMDSFEAITSNAGTGVSRSPGWSGFCDILASTQTSIVSPGSNFALTNTIQTNLGRVGNNFAIYFPNDPVAHMGTGTGNTITLANPAAPIVERYKLAWTSYALVVDANRDLILYYNFTPIRATPIVGASQILLKNVRNFKFERRGQTTRIKLCVEEFIDGNVTGTGIPSCKEKAIF
jgi:prepilin-type N-terminal cleavage/methylation domain-containing protein